MLKTCPKCKTEKLLNAFARNKTKFDGHSTTCKSCHATYNKEWYAKNRNDRRKAIIARRNRQTQQNKEYVKSVKLACLKCGESAYECLDFHHIDSTQKEHNITTLIRSGATIETCKKEINKCIVLCANCHRKYHAGNLIL